MVPVSAIKGENIDKLLEMLLLVTEVEDLQANPDRLARGTVIEAHLDKAKGPVATLLVQNGTLKTGDVVAAGPVLGKVRAMVDDNRQRLKEAGPSFAVEALGFSEVPPPVTSSRCTPTRNRPGPLWGIAPPMPAPPVLLSRWRHDASRLRPCPARPMTVS